MKVKRAAQEKNNYAAYDVLINNLIISVLVLHEEFEFGKSRIEQYIAGIIEKVKWFDEMSRDGVADIKTAAERKAYQTQFREFLRISTKEYLPEELYREVFETNLPTAAEVACRSKIKEAELQRKTAVSVAKAAEMQRAAQIYQDFLRDSAAKKY